MNNFKKKLVAVVLMAVMLCSCFACGGKGATTDAVNQTTAASEAVTEVNTESAVKVERIISVAPNMTELLYELGMGDKLVGRTKYCNYPEECLQVESIGTLRSPDIEKIISLKPDLVVASTHFKEDVAKQLEDAGVEVLVLYEEKSFDGVYDMIAALGDRVGCQAKAAEIIKDMKASIDATTKSVAGKETPSVYYVVGYGEGGDHTATGETFIHQMITMAGGRNVAENASGWSYSLEALLEADPDIIVLGESDKEGFMTADNYKELTAVKEGHVYTIDKNLLDRQGYRNAEGIATLAKIFHQ